MLQILPHSLKCCLNNCFRPKVLSFHPFQLHCVDLLNVKTKIRTQPIICDSPLSATYSSGASGKEPACQYRRHKRNGFGPWVRKISWRREWQPIPGFLPRESQGQRNLAGYGPWSHKELDMTHTTWHHPVLAPVSAEQCYF